MYNNQNNLNNNNNNYNNDPNNYNNQYGNVNYNNQINQTNSYSDQYQGNNFNNNNQFYQNNGFNNGINNNYAYNVPPSADSKPLIFGILAFLGILIPLAGYGFGITALVISIKGKNNPYNKYNTAGIILSIIALILSVIVHVITTLSILNAI